MEKKANLPTVTRRQFLKLGSATVVGACCAAIWPGENAGAEEMGSDLPFRSLDVADSECEARRYISSRLPVIKIENDLSQALKVTDLRHSLLGLANNIKWEEGESLEATHFRWAINPVQAYTNDGWEKFLLLDNGLGTGQFRLDEAAAVHKRMFDRGVWAIKKGYQTAVVVESDHDFSSAAYKELIATLCRVGVSTVVTGNEPNDKRWRDNMLKIYHDCLSASEITGPQTGGRTDVSLPGMAYFGNGEYLQRMLRTLHEISGYRGFPAQRVADHYYGPVDDFLPRIRNHRKIMEEEGAGKLLYDLNEVGNPTISSNDIPATPEQLADGFIIQIASLSSGSGLVDRFYIYNLFDPTSEKTSLARAENGRLIPKASYSAFIVAARLWSGIKKDRVAIEENRDHFKVAAERNDGLRFTVVWSRMEDKQIELPIARGTKVFDGLGRWLPDEESSCGVVLKHKEHPKLGGPAKILLHPS